MKITLSLIIFSFNFLLAQKVEVNYKSGWSRIIIQNEIKENGKVYNLINIENQFIFYKVFNAFDPETDFGETYLKVLRFNGDSLWSKEVEQETEISYNSKLIITYEREPFSDQSELKLNFYNLLTGEALKQVGLTIPEQYWIDQVVTVSNESFISFKDREGILRMIRRIDLVSFKESEYSLKKVGYYTLHKKFDKDQLIDKNKQVVLVLNNK